MFYDLLLEEIFAKVRELHWFTVEYTRDMETSGILKGKYGKAVRRTDFYNLFAKYAVMPEKSQKYNKEENDFQYDLQMPISNFKNKDRGSFSSGMEWKIKIITISLNYLINARTLYYTVGFRVKVKRPTGISITTEPVKTLDLFVGMSRALKDDFGGKFLLISPKKERNYKVDRTLYDFLEETAPGTFRPIRKTMGTVTVFGVVDNITYNDNGRRFYLSLKGARSPGPKDQYVRLRVRPPDCDTLIFPQLHKLNLLLQTYASPIPGKTLTNALVGWSGSPKLDSSTFNAETQRENHTGIYFGNAPNYQTDLKARITKVRSLPMARGFDSGNHYSPSLQKMGNENWDVLGVFTLYLVKGSLTYSGILGALDLFERKIVNVLPVSELLLSTDPVLFNIIGKMGKTDLKNFQTACKDLQTQWAETKEWITHHIEEKSGSPTTILYSFLTKLKKDIFHTSREPAFVHLCTQYFEFLRLVPVTDQYVLENGVYLFKWKRAKLKGLDMKRDLEDEIDPSIHDIEYEYIYRYVPSKYKNVTPSGTEWVYVPPSDGYEANHDTIFKQIVLSYGKDYATQNHIRFRASLKFVIDRTKTPAEISLQGVQMTLPLRIWVLERSMLDFYEEKYFEIKEIENILVT